MSQPFIYINNARIKEGTFDEVQGFVKRFLDTLKEHEPQIIAFHVFANEEMTEVTIIQVHPDTASMDRHMEVLQEKLSEYEAKALGSGMFEFTHAGYYGTPNEAALAMDRGIAGLDIDIKPIHVAGFTQGS